MKKVVIADDELLVRVGLKSTIPWKENGFVVVGEAKNGKECIELFKKFDPDILITDIKMPIINGLELIQILKQKKSNIKVVILSHYDDFNYAKEAIKLGASEYMLKSDLSSENLLGVLKKLSKELDEANNNSIAEKSKNIKTSIDYDNLIKKLITGKYNSKDEFKYILDKVTKEFKYNSFVVINATVYKNDVDEVYDNDYSKYLTNRMDYILSNVFNDGEINNYSAADAKNITYLLNINCSEDKEVKMKKLENLVNHLKKDMNQLLEVDLSVGISNIEEKADKIPELINRAQIAQKYSYFNPLGIDIFKENMIVNQKTECPRVSLDALKNYVKTLDIDCIDNYIDNIFDELIKLKKIEYVKNVFTDFLSQAKIIIDELGIKVGPALSESKLSYNNIEKLNNFQMVKSYVHDIYHELIYFIKDKNSRKYSYLINRVIEYIKTNYRNNISLSDAAEHVQISKCYLSFLFKEETGINFSSFLINYRIEKSKDLLSKSNLKVYEIADEVGFDNPHYFSKVFKNITGLTCKEFKKFNSAD